MFSNKFPILLNQIQVRLASTQSVKVPLRMYDIEGRYATALYTAATKKKNLDTVEIDLKKLQSTFDASKTIKSYVQSPVIRKRDKIASMKTLGRELKFCDSTSNFLVLLAENGRLDVLRGIMNSFQLLMAAHRNEIICEIVTATPLDSEQEKKLLTVLKGYVGNKTIKMKKTVNPEIMGGMNVLIGDRYVDMSIASKVKKYCELVRASV